MKTNSFLSAAIFALAITFTFSCSSDDGGSGGDGSSSSAKGKSSSSKQGQSSSDGTGSSSSGDKGASSSSAGVEYKTIKIGNQTWMAENLNITTASGSTCYDGKPTNCNKYGRLYDWKTAKSICPSGWHLPTNEEWETLISSLGGEEEAGAKLKSANGFAALPSGYGDSDGDFSDADFSDAEDYGYWWTATDEDDEDYAWYWKIDYEYEEVSNDYDDKTNLYSVRCIQNTQSGKSSSSGGGVSSSSVGKSSSSSGGSSSSKDDSSSSSSDGGTPVKCPNAVTGNNTLSCGGQTYKTVVIGGKTWTAENMNYAVKDSRCYGEGTSGVSADSIAKNCKTYGRLYNMDAAQWYVCPEGWHLPSGEEWDKLGDEAAKLKAKSGWPIYKNEEGTTDYNGTNESGFSALPGGCYGTGIGGFCNSGGGYVGVGYIGYWHIVYSSYSVIDYSLSGVTKSGVGGGSDGYHRQVRESIFFSVRCVKD